MKILKFMHKMEEAYILIAMAHFEVLLRKDMNKKFTVEICSDLDYEEMVADVSYENHTVAMITQENGVDKIEIAIFPFEKTKSWVFLLTEFIESIEFAKQCLIKMQKIRNNE